MDDDRQHDPQDDDGREHDEFVDCLDDDRLQYFRGQFEFQAERQRFGQLEFRLVIAQIQFILKKQIQRFDAPVQDDQDADASIKLASVGMTSVKTACRSIIFLLFGTRIIQQDSSLFVLLLFLLRFFDPEADDLAHKLVWDRFRQRKLDGTF